MTGEGTSGEYDGICIRECAYRPEEFKKAVAEKVASLLK